jgi:hypothetical protein
MIRFRCWYCNKRYTVPEERFGERIDCTCERRVRVPRHNGGNCRVRTPLDWLVEALVYGGGGALLGLGLALLILALFRGAILIRVTWVLIPALTLLGFLAGLFGGERGINWIGRMIRDQENSEDW